MDDLSGRIIRSYHITERINSGGFGAVYHAYQPVIEREVALKVILPRYANEIEFIRRFEVEAQTVAQLEHPYIVPVYDYWRDPEGAFIVMRLMRGGSLRDVIADQDAVPLANVAQYLDQISSALGFAHRHNIIHRDIKPENILRDEEGNNYLTDFGIAQRNDVDLDSGELSSLAGSVNYISPEIIRGQRPHNTSDVYSLGIMVFEMLTGHLPYQSPSAPAMLNMHLSELFPSVHNYVSHLPEVVDHVLERACAKDPEDRYPSVRDFARAFRQVAGIDNTAPIDIIETAEVFKIVDNPYKGLRPFSESDAQDFFGRDDLIERLVERLNQNANLANFLAVVGPSGSGKSSVVRAGLIPQMRLGAVGDTQNWFIIDMLPDDDPISNLASGLLSLASTPLSDLEHRLRTDEKALIWANQQLLQDTDDGHLLLFIDQFEEVFTLSDDESMRLHLLNLLNYTVRHAHNIVIIVTIRADFFDKPLLYDGIGDLLQARTQVVLPLTAQEIEWAITGPADNANIIVDRDLIAAIIADVRDEPGALPLLQYTLTELFERRDSNRLTLDSYVDSGGVLGSIAKRAQDVYDDLLVVQRQLTRQIFLRLVTLGEGTEDTRRRVQRSELLNLGDDRQQIEKILNIFGSYRLLTFDRDPATRVPTVEIAHEALIKRWDDLKKWLDESRNDVRLQRSLASASQEWVDNGQQEGYLLYDERLAQYQQWLTNTSVAINEQERAYLDASIAEKQAQDKLEEQRQARERELEQRDLRRSRLVSWVMAVAFLITLALTIVAVLQRQIAQEESANAISARATSDANALAADARANEIQNFNLISIAQQAITDGDSGLAVSLLNIVSNTTNLSPAVQSELYPAVYASQLRGRLENHTDTVTALAISADGRWIATGSEDLTVILWDGDTQSVVHQLTGHRGIISDLAFSPDNRQLVSVANDGLGIVWDVETGTEILQLRGHRGPITGVDYAPDSTQIATSSGDDSIILWDAITGEIVNQLTGHSDSVRSVVYSPQGDSLISASRDTTLILWDVATGQMIRTLSGHSDSVQSVDFSTSGRQIVSGGFDRVVIIWDVETGAIVSRLIGHNDEVTSVAFSPTDRSIVSTSCAERDIERTCIRGEILIWDPLSGRERLNFLGHTEIINDAIFTADGRQVLTASCGTQRQNSCIAGETLIWDIINTTDRIQQLNGHDSSVYSVDYDHDSQRLLSGGGSLLLEDQPQGDTSIVLWDTTSGIILNRFTGHSGNVTELEFHRNGSTFLSASRDSTVRIWLLDARQPLRQFEQHTGSVYDIEMTSDGSQVLSAGDRRVLLWDYESLEIALSLENFGAEISARSLAISPDDSIIATGLNNGVIILWDSTTGEEIRRLTGHTDDLLTLEFTSDGAFLLSGSQDRSVRRWDVATGTQLQAYMGHLEAVTDVTVTGDSRYVLSASDDNTMRYWDMATGDLIREFRGHTGQIFDASLSADGNIAYTASADGSVIGWRVSVDALINWMTTNRYQRNLTTDELDAFQITLDEE
ncbi:MAG: protein kinase [Chloroflexota bacterium]